MRRRWLDDGAWNSAGAAILVPCGVTRRIARCCGTPHSRPSPAKGRGSRRGRLSDGCAGGGLGDGAEFSRSGDLGALWCDPPHRTFVAGPLTPALSRKGRGVGGGGLMRCAGGGWTTVRNWSRSGDLGALWCDPAASHVVAGPLTPALSRKGRGSRLDAMAGALMTAPGHQHGTGRTAWRLQRQTCRPRRGSMALPTCPSWSPATTRRPNVAPLVAALDAALTGIAWEVVFVDDDSPDRHGGGGAPVRPAGRARCAVSRRVGRRGLSSAVVEGALASSWRCSLR